MDWIERLNDAVKYIEENLSSDIDYSLAAQRACCSLYHFQRMFSYISGIPLSEYVRRRKMSLAAADIIGGEKIIDVAVKYGYSSPTAFNRAFKSVHGVAPSDARSCGTVLKSYPPLVFKITVKGVYEMNYRIEKKDAFVLSAYHRLWRLIWKRIFPLYRFSGKNVCPTAPLKNFAA